MSDAQGGVIPGAAVVVKNNATGVTYDSVTDGTGRFVVPAVPPGTYTVRVSLMGFKTAVAPDVQIVTATPASIKLTLQVGALEEAVVVTGAADVVQTQSATVSKTIDVKAIQQLPVITHTALDYVVSLAGVETVGSNTRGSTINGLPTTSINITLDGVNVQDKRGNEGFFMFIRPMMDSVEEITVSTSTPGADASGSGGASIRMETRAGSNRFSASAYNTWRNQAGTNDSDAIARTKHPGWLWKLNTPYWFNKRDLPKTAAGDYFINDTRLQTPGFRVGGPIFKDKVFYFGNYEEFRLPESRSRTRTILNTAAQFGTFTYPRVDNGALQTINLLTLAASKGQTSTTDPSIAKLLADIRTASATTGAIRTFDQNNDQYDYVPSATQMRKFPTVRLDYNVTTNHRLSGTYRYNDFNSNPDFLNSAEARFPGFANVGNQVSGRYSWQTNLHSVFGKIVNEIKVGGQDATGLGSYFGKGVDASQFNCSGLGCQSAGGRGFSFTFPTVGTTGLTGASASTGPSSSVAAQFTIDDTVTWIKGNHSLSAGGAFTRINSRNWAITPIDATLGFGTGSTDPAFAMLDSVQGSSNFPGGINSTFSGYAKNLYGFLTGRVNSIGATYYLQPDGTYKAQAERTNQVTADDFGFFVADSWRVKPNLTVTLGLRYELQLPMVTDGLYSRPRDWEMVYGITGAGDGLYGSGNLYKPGVMTGTNPVLVQMEKGKSPYKTDKNNFAPSFGFAWRPSFEESFLTKIVGKDPVFRGGYSISYSKLGTNFFDSNYGGNPGRSRAGSRTVTSGTPFLGADGLPVLLRDTARITASAAPAALTGAWAITPAINESIDIHYPEWPVTMTHQYSFGIQRQIGREIGIDVRYVGNTNVGGWTTWNMNATQQWSMLKGENGFLDEFRTAQANLRANIVAGRGNTFAYTGAAGTAPLPIFQAYFAGIPLADARNNVPANYTSANYSSSTWFNSLGMYNPALGTIAGTGTSGLQNGIGTGTGLDANRIKAGLPINFFMANPAVAQGGSFLETTAGNTRFNAMQVDLTKRMSHGFMVSANYAFAFGRKTWSQRSLREQDWRYIDSGGGSTHTFKANWVYELPFGKGKAFGRNAGGVLEGFIGGWEIDGIARVQSGQKFNYGGFRLVGMDEKDLQKMFKFYHETGTDGVERIFMLPQDVIQQSILALSNFSATTATGYSGALPTGRYLAPASGPDCVQYLAGDCPGTTLTRFITGPKYWKVDLSLVKKVNLVKNLRLEARMDIFNVFDTINFNATSATGSALTSWQVTSAAQDVNASQDPGGRITQFGLRITW
ncbi:MAG: TonB-dependent receptor [Gemmatimonadetes bacterium]|nr:TonB-dependent receptor [Gemmatimonadota bacterium]